MTSSMIKDFARELKDDESAIKDVTLVGSDGGSTHAAKAVLAIRSPVFRRMFYGNFRESQEDCDSVKLNYPSNVLRAVVTYCYTNKARIQNRDPTFRNGNSGIALVRLLDAASYLDMTKLRELIEDVEFERCDRKYTFDIIQELMIRGLTDGKLWVMSMEVLMSDPKYWVVQPKWPTCIGGISIRVLDRIFDYAKKDTPASWLIKGLQSWNKSNESATEAERALLQTLVDDISLESMEIEELAQVQSCSLFSQDRLQKAFFALSKKPQSKKRKRTRGRRDSISSSSDSSISSDSSYSISSYSISSYTSDSSNSYNSSIIRGRGRAMARAARNRARAARNMDRAARNRARAARNMDRAARNRARARARAVRARARAVKGRARSRSRDESAFRRRR